jgi:hypothetical protein
MAENERNDDATGRSRTAPIARPKWQTLALRALALCALLAFAWLAWSGFRTLRAGLGARRDLASIQSLAADPSFESLPALRENMAALDAHLGTVQAAGRPFWWLASRLGWLPRYGTDLRNAPALLATAAGLASGGHQALQALSPVGDALGRRGRGDLMAEAVPALMEAGPALAAADGQLGAAAAARAQISGPLSPGVSRLVEKVDRVLPLARTALRLAQMAPDLLGASGTRTYLILAQNSNELRATGGFISSAGILRLDKGRITDLRVTDSYAVDNFDQPHPDAPAVLAEQMGAQQLLLRDSNWSPDFPTSAQIARTLYEQDQGVTTDGAVAIDIEAVRLLVGAVEPLDVPGMAAPVTAANALDLMIQAWQQPATSNEATARRVSSEWWARRKDFAGPMMMAALAKLQSGAGFRPAALAAALMEMLDGRHLQLAVDDKQAAQVIKQQGWDGALQPPRDSDFLGVVDSNLGFNKTNAAVQQAIDYRVGQDGDGLLATLTLTYTHTAPFLSGTCDRVPRYGGSYDDMINRCHWNYLRVYVPGDSNLVSAEGITGASAEVGEGGATVLAGSFMLRPTESHVVQLRYRLPTSLASGPYRLFVRKQAGTPAVPLAVQADTCRWESTLARDRRFECTAWKK